MNLVITHYHLETSGVTRVITGQLRALEATQDSGAPLRVFVFHGGARYDPGKAEVSRRGGLDVEFVLLPGLSYDGAAGPEPASLGSQFLSFFVDHNLSPDDTVVHAHNHSLGRNSAVPAALGALAEAGYPLLLQIHDFAEDFRPDNYRHLVQTLGAGDPHAVPARLYPQASHIHYAVLNNRDGAILSAAGVAPERLHLLANPVSAPAPLPRPADARRRLFDRFAVEPSERFVLYPVRCIRRKNVGETLLWSALAPDATRFGMTLPPSDPRDQPTYRRWRDLAAELKLPCLFETSGAHGLDFTENLAAADLIITTSVTEGFGLPILESWLTGHTIVGRDLPEITRDFRATGVQLDYLRPRLDVSLDWIGARKAVTSLEQSYREILSAYGRPQPDAETLRAKLDSVTRNDSIDFAQLSGPLQTELIRMVCEDSARQRALSESNAWIGESLALESNAAHTQVTNNSRIIAKKYSDEACGRRLSIIYRRVLASPRASSLAPPARREAVLNAFLDIARFHPIRVEE
ncbi:MAG: hypothetical protein O7G83_06020 [Proteobacteria bacterium]|nr:hypothetical protein [Pseudomonadota bacterium]